MPGQSPAGFGIRLTALMVDNLVLALVNLALIYCFAPDGPESLSWSDWLPTITARFNVYYSGPWWLCLAAWSKDTLYSLVRLRSSPVVVGPQLAPERAEIPMGRTRPRGVRRKPKQLPTARANSHAGRQTRPDSRAEPGLPDRRRQSRPGTTLARRTDHDLMYALPRALPQYQGARLAGCQGRSQTVPQGCDLKGKIHWLRYCDSEHYEKPEGRLLRIVGLLPRCSEEWKAKYKLRTVIERYFSSAKHNCLMDKHRYFSISEVSLHVAMSMLSYLATAMAHLKADDYTHMRHMRHMRIRLPKVRERKPEPVRDVDPIFVAALLLHELSDLQRAA